MKERRWGQPTTSASIDALGVGDIFDVRQYQTIDEAILGHVDDTDEYLAVGRHGWGITSADDHGNGFNPDNNVRRTVATSRAFGAGWGGCTDVDSVGIVPALNTNTYSYALNNPLLYTDPLGLWPMYGNWGGSNYSGGQSGSTIPADPAPPKDALDACYKAA